MLAGVSVSCGAGFVLGAVIALRVGEPGGDPPPFLHALRAVRCALVTFERLRVAGVRLACAAVGEDVAAWCNLFPLDTSGAAAAAFERLSGSEPAQGRISLRRRLD